MLDWKILGASVAALLIASTVLVSGAGGMDFGLGDIFERITEWLKSSPFGGFFQSPVASLYEVDITLYPKTYTLKTISTVNLSVDSVDLIEFNGYIDSDFINKKLVFRQDSTPLKIEMPLKNITISSIKVDRIYLDDTDFVVTSNELDTSGQNATIEITDFSGDIQFYPDYVEFHGNVSMIKGNNNDIV